MKKSVGNAALTAALGLGLATNVVAKDMNEVKGVDTSHLDKDKVSSVVNDTKDKINDIRVYGVGERYNDGTSDGGGIEIEGSNYKLGLEGTEDYSRAFGVAKGNFSDNAYTKVGAGFLQREIPINGKETDVDQTTLGGSIGYGNNTNYNVEAGYIWNDLDNAGRADTTTNALFVEGIAKYDSKYGGIETILSYEDVKAYDERFRNTSAGLGLYPTEDMRLGVDYTSKAHDSNDYRVLAGLNYRWGKDILKGDISPFVRASASTSDHVRVTGEYREGIQNKPLQMGDKFEEGISTTNFTAKEYNPTEFDQRTTVTTPDTVDNTPTTPNTAPTASNATIDAGLGEIVTLDLAGNITDAETSDANLTISVESGPSHGSLVWNTNSEFTYTVTQGSFYMGDDSFTYKVTDPQGGESQVRTVTITNVMDS